MEVASIIDFLENRKLSFEDLVGVATGALNKSVKGFDAMKNAGDLKSLEESFDCGMRWLTFFENINRIRVPKEYPDRVREFRDAMYPLAETRYQKL